jgi:hypothetical protein
MDFEYTYCRISIIDEKFNEKIICAKVNVEIIYLYQCFEHLSFKALHKSVRLITLIAVETY